MQIKFKRSHTRRVRRAGFEAAQTLSIASQMALLCPSGMDVWMQRELAAGLEAPSNGAEPRR